MVFVVYFPSVWFCFMFCSPPFRNIQTIPNTLPIERAELADCCEAFCLHEKILLCFHFCASF